METQFGNLISAAAYSGRETSTAEAEPILFYHPSDNAWWLGTFNSGAITWGPASNTKGFGNLISSGCLFWTGDFNGGGSDQILFYHPSDGNWFLARSTAVRSTGGFLRIPRVSAILYRVVAYSGRETSTAEAATKFSSTTPPTTLGGWDV